MRKTMTFAAPESEVEARNRELATFIKRTTTTLINAGYMGRDNDKRIVWWTGKSDRPRPRPERPPERPAPLPEDVRNEINSLEPPF